MSKILTASEARKLADVVEEVEVKEVISRIMPEIEKAAKAKKRSLRTGWDYQGDNHIWILEGYGNTALWKACKAELEKHGYKVTFYYNPMSMAVDMYTLIEW